jgi:hypothetical protein
MGNCTMKIIHPTFATVSGPRRVAYARWLRKLQEDHNMTYAPILVTTQKANNKPFRIPIMQSFKVHETKNSSRAIASRRALNGKFVRYIHLPTIINALREYGITVEDMDIE